MEDDKKKPAEEKPKAEKPAIDKSTMDAINAEKQRQLKTQQTVKK